VMHYANLHSLGKLASRYLSYFAIMVRCDQNTGCWQQHTERRAEQSTFFFFLNSRLFKSAVQACTESLKAVQWHESIESEALCPRGPI